MKLTKHKIETREEEKWFSVIKQKAREIKFGCLDFSLVIKGGQVVALRGIKEIETYNISGKE